MSDLTKTCVAAVLLLGLGGCSTAIYGSAPAREGYVYAVGSRNGKPAAWLCPAAKKGECVEVSFNTDE